MFFFAATEICQNNIAAFASSGTSKSYQWAIPSQRYFILAEKPQGWTDRIKKTRLANLLFAGPACRAKAVMLIE
jgi:hypothetical protein